MIQFANPSADLFIPDDFEPSQALDRTTHLGVGAHQDDLEVMALHGILACYKQTEKWFGGVTVTNGMLLKQGIPVMIPVMWVACFVLIQQEHI